MESKHNWFYCARLVNLVLVCRHWVSMYVELAPDSLASRYLFIECLHLSDISYWAYWIGLFQHDSLIFILKKNRLTKRAPDVWESARFISIFLASSFSCSQAESTPAQNPLPQTVSQNKLPSPFWKGQFSFPENTNYCLPTIILAARLPISTAKFVSQNYRIRYLF